MNDRFANTVDVEESFYVLIPRATHRAALQCECFGRQTYVLGDMTSFKKDESISALLVFYLAPCKISAQDESERGFLRPVVGEQCRRIAFGKVALPQHIKTMFSRIVVVETRRNIGIARKHHGVDFNGAESAARGIRAR